MDAVADSSACIRSRSTSDDIALENNNAILPNFLITAASTQGGRRYMEDRLQIEVGRKANGTLEFVYAAVYDGHGGPQASEYVRQHLFNNIVSNRSFFSDDDHLVLEAIREGFLRTHTDMQREATCWPPTTSGFPCTAGTTATCAFVRNGKLYTGHVGDSSIVLANFAETDAGYKDAKLTDDHKPDITSERQRIERAGGAVAMKSGIFRVIWKRPVRGHRGPVRRSTATENIPFLAVARSLGDFWSLNPDSNEYVVSPEPDVDVFELKDTDNFIVVASDGLSTVVGTRAVIETLRETEQQFVQHFCHDIDSSTTDNNASNNNGPLSSLDVQQNIKNMLLDVGTIDKDLPLNHAHCLLQFALNKWGTLRADNISIICLKLNANEAPTEQSVLLDDRCMNVCDALTEHPMAMLRITDHGAQLLRTNALRHRYFGTVDKSVKFPSVAAIQNCLAATTAENDLTTTILGDDGTTAKVKRMMSHIQQQQQAATAAADVFTGPGFVRPEHVLDVGKANGNDGDAAANSGNNDNTLMMNIRRNDNECAAAAASSGHGDVAKADGLVTEVVDVVADSTTTAAVVLAVPFESDVEEAKEPSEVELALSTTSSSELSDWRSPPSLLHPAGTREGLSPKSRTLRNLDSVKALAESNGTVKWKTKSTKWKGTMNTATKQSPPARQSLKRRLEDDNIDGENDDHGVGHHHQQKQHRYSAFGLATTTPTTTRVSLEGDDYAMGGGIVPPTARMTKPPPAKRSRIQHVFNFITNLFGFRWPT